MKWITKEELERDLNELLPDKDVCDLILILYFRKSPYCSLSCSLVRSLFHLFAPEFVCSFVILFTGIHSLDHFVHSFFRGCFFSR